MRSLPRPERTLKRLAYLLLDDGFAEHTKLDGLPVQAKWLHVCALIYCAKNLTDGVVSERKLKVIAAVAEVRAGRFVPLLEERGMWIPRLDGWYLHDYLEHNPSAEQVKAKRKARAEAGRRGGIASGHTRSKPEANGEANASRSVEPHPIPSQTPVLHPVALATRPLPLQPGNDAHASETQDPGRFAALLAATGFKDGALTKLQRAAGPRAPEADLVAAIEAASAKDVRDRLAVALTVLAQRRKERAA